MKTINWDEAPGGATHHNDKLPCQWLKESPLSYWFDNGWIRYDDDTKGRSDIAAAVPKPFAYKDVGSTLEYWYAEGDCWRKGEVIAHAKGKVVVMDSEDDGVGLYASTQIRRLKTTTELAQEKKEDEIAQMRRIVIKATLEGVDPVEALHEAGARVIVDAY